jgi:5'-phosphate synthase pdxT subunit
MVTVGVLALQGAFIEHIAVLRCLGVRAVEVRLPHELENLSGLIIPGGESTTVGKLATAYDLIDPIKRMADEGTPLWGTCAGLIFLARRVEGVKQPLLGLMDVTVRRNAFGRQVDSFETQLSVPALDAVSDPEERGLPFPAVFIRAPAIESVGEEVQVLSHLNEAIIVAARQDNLLATAFHPELSNDTRLHRYFLAMIEKGERAS